MLGIEFLLVPVVLLLLTVYLPLPRILNSWFSRFIAAILFLYALLQLSSLVQFYLYPSGGFKFITVLLAVVTLILIHPFKKRYIQKRKIFNTKDIAAIVGCLLFILPFSSIFIGKDSINQIARISSVQVTDSISHEGAIAGFSKVQNLDYTQGHYYPLGFHISTGFIEESLFGGVDSLNWTAHSVVYFLRYVFFGTMLCYLLIYFSFQLLVLIGRSRDEWAIWTVAVSVGFSTTLMHLFLFVNDGFINYYYICLTLLLGGLYILDQDLKFSLRKSNKENFLSYTWPFTAFLLLGFGATYSWPLLVPPVLLGALLLFLQSDLTKKILTSKKYYFINVPVTVLALLNLFSIYQQIHYMKTGSQLLNAYGAVQIFHSLFILGGVVLIFYTIISAPKNIDRRLASFIVPYVVFVFALMTMQLFLLGEARYYLIKTSIFLELIIISLLGVWVMDWARRSRLQIWLSSLTALLVSLFVVVGFIASSPQPFLETRSVFRNTSGLPKPPMFESDTKLVTRLGVENKIQDFNMTIVHYNSERDLLYAHIETAIWAHAMSPSYHDKAMSITGSRSSNCFGKQFAILAYGKESREEQSQLIESIHECLAAAKNKNLDYYIITDEKSVEYLKQLFGEQPQFIY